MAIFPGTKGEDVSAWRGAVELVAGIRDELVGRLTYLLPGADVALIGALRGRVESELAKDERFREEFEEVLSALATTAGEDQLASAYRRGRRAVADHFRHRGSVLVLHRCCTAMQDVLVGRVLRFTEEWMARSGYGDPPAPYCWFASGNAGRSEASTSGEHDGLIVYGETDAAGSGYFTTFSLRVAALLEHVGIRSARGITPVFPAWRGSINEWRGRLAEEVAGERRGEELPELARFADLRQVSGTKELGDEMTNLARSLLSFQKGGFRLLARGAADMTTGLDFFGRLRVAKHGAHRGEFNHEQFAFAPLVANVRVLAMDAGVAATATVDRIKGLLEGGRLDVDLAQRLLRSYHDFMARRLTIEIARGAGAGYSEYYLKPEELSSAEEEELKSGLEAVMSLQRIVYQSLAVHG